MSRTHTRSTFLRRLRDPLLALSAALLVTASLFAEEAYAPYDEGADAEADVRAAFERAQANGKLVFLQFGANWCPDCRHFARLLDDPVNAGYVGEHFEIVKIDVGRWDRNDPLVERYGNPTAEGIPAAVVMRADGSEVLATRGGQLSIARQFDAEQVRQFVNAIVQASVLPGKKPKPKTES